MKQLYKFSASWCQPCKMLASNFKYVNLGDVELVELDIEENSDKAVEFKIRSVPTMVLIEDGKEIKRTSGVLMADKIEEFIK